MSIAAIIAEYNPFHAGHLYQIQALRRILGEDTRVLALMSGDFVQRGEAAVMDKYLRTRLALEAGVSAVAQLPVWIATASAADFAEGAVRILNALGCVDWLCCGVENDNLELLEQTASVFRKEPEPYKSLLKEHLTRGKSFPAARENAFLQYVTETGAAFYQEERDAGFLRMPNNILAIAYLQALQKTGSSIRLLPVRRLGNYHSDPAARAIAVRKKQPAAGIPSPSQSGDRTYPCQPGNRTYPGAAEIRRELIRQREHGRGGWMLPEALLTSPDAGPLLTAKAGRTWPVAQEDFFIPLKLALSMREKEYEDFADVPEEMARRLAKGWFAAESLDGLAEYLHTANYTRSRAGRALLHILLGIRREDVRRYKEGGWAYYLRILGFRTSEEDLIRKLPAASEIPVLLRAKLTAQEEETWSPEALDCWHGDIDAAEKYELIRSMTAGLDVSPIREYSRGVIRV